MTHVFAGRVAVALSACLMLAPAASVAQETYPDREIVLVVPFPAGGGVDVTARRIAEAASKSLGQPVVVENRPGAGSLIGAETVRQAEADGYTLLMASSAFVTNVTVGTVGPYDPLADFTPVTLMTFAPNVLVTGKDAGFADLADLVTKAKAEPGGLSYATYGDRSAPHLASLNFERAAGIELMHIPYTGGTPAMTALLSGETGILFSSVLPVLPQIQAGQLLPLAIAADARVPALPEVPTFKELGFDFTIGTWFGIVAPAGLPAPVVEKLNATFQAIAADPAFAETVAAEGSTVLALPPADFATRLADEVAFWKAFAVPSAN